MKAYGLLAAVIFVVPAQAQEWTYGKHPVLGLSAHVTLADGNAIGLACNQRDYDPMRDHFVALRVTQGLVQQNSFLVVSEPPAMIRQYSSNDSWKKGSGYTQWTGNTCEIDISTFRRSKELLTSFAQMGRFGSDGGGQYIEIDYGGRTIKASQSNGYSAIPDLRRIPLKGSSAAIQNLINACPSIQQDIADNCGM